MTVTATPHLLPQHSTPTVSLDTLMEAFECRWRQERDIFLTWVDERERLAGISPRTSEIRAWWVKRGRPGCGNSD